MSVIASRIVRVAALIPIVTAAIAAGGAVDPSNIVTDAELSELDTAIQGLENVVNGGGAPVPTEPPTSTVPPVSTTEPVPTTPTDAPPADVVPHESTVPGVPVAG